MADPSTANDSPSPNRHLGFPLRTPIRDGIRLDREALKDLFIMVGVPVFVVVAAFWIAARYVKPAPPSHFVMTTGADGGAYHLYAQRYREILHREKIAITLKPSAGSLENLKRLLDSHSQADAALSQAGVASPEAVSDLRSLGAIYYEPLWIFYRGGEVVDKLSQLAGKRIAIGSEGSGTRALGLQLLKVSGVEDSSSNLPARDLAGAGIPTPDENTTLIIFITCGCTSILYEIVCGASKAEAAGSPHGRAWMVT